MNINNYIFDANERRRNDISKLSSEKVINPFFKAVVTHVLTDDSAINASDFYQLSKQIEPSTQEFRIPKNSIIARIIDQGVDSIGSESNTNYVIAYPFFSSHFCLPVKEGETAWIVFDSDDKNKGYWLSRVAGDEFSEDLNFSHFDRSQAVIPNVNEISTTPGTYEKSRGSPRTFQESQSINAPEDDFPNISLNQDFENYEQIFSKINTDINQLEPVPRYKKRPGDLVLQGSNNTLISLTTDRGWSSLSSSVEENQSNVNEKINPFSGTIDIVAGRSRKISSENERGIRTNPNTYLNTRGYEEVSKENYQGQKLQTEGDPDFLDDAARVYVSSKMKVDDSFGLRNMTPTNPGEIDPILPSSEEESSAIAIKADEIRIIAREDSSNNFNGSITILKEGDPSSNGCAIQLQPDGTILISGDRIFVGRSSANGGQDSGSSDAPGNSQPFVKYQQLEELLSNIISDVNQFCDTLITHVTPGFGAPSPQITSAATQLKIKMQQRELEIPSIKSTRIFGE